MRIYRLEHKIHRFGPYNGAEIAYYEKSLITRTELESLQLIYKAAPPLSSPLYSLWQPSFCQVNCWDERLGVCENCQIDAEKTLKFGTKSFESLEEWFSKEVPNFSGLTMAKFLREKMNFHVAAYEVPQQYVFCEPEPGQQVAYYKEFATLVATM